MLEHVLTSAKALAGDHATILVLGHGGEFIQEFLSKTAFQAKTALQSEQKGTGHAVLQACDQLSDDSVTLILYGDVPLIQTQTLQQLAQLAESGGLGLLTQDMANPTGYGRILRNQDGDVSGIVEEKDANAEIRQIN
jgi:bifunctional UDP-N-acetylglucosamine pyrophosphorylase/glucosamine-1-phosphate N-acetyltransferase